MDFRQRDKLRAFDRRTTYIHDYTTPALEPYHKYKWENRKVVDKPPRPPPEHLYTCYETLSKLRPEIYIPANLTWLPRPIVQKPLDYCVQYDIKEEPTTAEVIKTRPRVYMGPAVSIDDIPDAETRDLLVKFMYTTDFKRSMKEAQDYTHAQLIAKRPKDIDCPDKSAAVIPTCLVKDEHVDREVPDLFPPVDSQIRKNFHEWDRQQLRACVDPTTKFWGRFYKDRKPGFDPQSSSLIPDETVDFLTRLIQEDKLKRVHDLPICGYGGLVPDIAPIQVEKVPLPKEHPMHTTYEMVYINHFDHANNNFEK